MIKDGSVLYNSPYGEIPLIITHSERQQSIVVSCQFSDTIAKVKAKISRITSSHQLFFQNMPLQDEPTVEECRITPSSELLVVGPGEIPVYIKSSFKEHFVCVKTSAKVNDLKIAISNALFTPVEKQKLVTSQQTMISTNTIAQYGICAGTTVFLAVIPNEVVINITLPITKKVVSLICSLNETIEDVKLKIEQSEGIPVYHQILPFDNDRTTLYEANIAADLNIQLQCMCTQVDKNRFIGEECRHVTQILRINKLSKELQSTKKYLDDGIRILMKLREGLFRLKHTLSKVERQINEKIQTFVRRLAGSDAKLERLQKEMIVQKSLDDAHRENQTLQESLNDAQRENQTLQERLNDAHRENQTLQERLDDAHRESQTLQGSLNDAHRENRTLQERLNDAQRENRTLQERLDDAHRESQILQGSLNDAHRENRTLQGSLNDVQRENRTLQERLNDAQRENRTLQERLDDAHRESQTLQGSLNDAHRENRTLQGSLREKIGHFKVA